MQLAGNAGSASSAGIAGNMAMLACQLVVVLAFLTYWL